VSTAGQAAQPRTVGPTPYIPFYEDIMSYDIKLFMPKENEEPIVTARRDIEMEEPPMSKPDPDKEALKKKVASALMKANPRLEKFSFDYREIARFKKITIEEAKSKYRNIELNEPEGGNCVQIELYDNQAFITVPYFHKNQKAEIVFKDIWNYMKIIQRETGFVAYDPQADMILDLSQGYTQALEVYRNVNVKWWQFWRR
jgi:hypothetical protein